MAIGQGYYGYNHLADATAYTYSASNSSVSESAREGIAEAHSCRPVLYGGSGVVTDYGTTIRGTLNDPTNIVGKPITSWGERDYTDLFQKPLNQLNQNH